MTPASRWPFPDSPLKKSRRMAGAYRESAERFQQIATELKDAIEKINERLIGFDSAVRLSIIQKALKNLPDVQTVEQLDQRFADWGETWHLPEREHYDDEEWVDSHVAGRILQYAPGYILRLRVDNRLPGRWDPTIGHKGAYLFQVKALREFEAKHTRRVTKASLYPEPEPEPTPPPPPPPPPKKKATPGRKQTRQVPSRRQEK